MPDALHKCGISHPDGSDCKVALRQAMARAALRRNTEEYNKLQYLLSLLNSEPEPESEPLARLSEEPLARLHPELGLGKSVGPEARLHTESSDEPSSSVEVNQNEKAEKSEGDSAMSLTGQPSPSIASESPSESSVVSNSDPNLGFCTHCGIESELSLCGSVAEGEMICPICTIGTVKPQDKFAGWRKNGEGKSPYCVHTCQCGRKWTHMKESEPGKGECAYWRHEELLCPSCKKVREQTATELLGKVIHSSSEVINVASLGIQKEVMRSEFQVNKDVMQIMLDEESSCKSMTDEELEQHIVSLDEASAQIMARRKGARKERRNRYEDLEEREVQAVRRSWHDVEQASPSVKKKILDQRDKREKSAVNAREKAVESFMQMFNVSREQAEAMLQKHKK